MSKVHKIHKNIENTSNDYVPKICFCAIFKNESKICIRSLTAAHKNNFIDFISICDTGSTDGTPTKIRKWAESVNISCKIHTARTNIAILIQDNIIYLKNILKQIENKNNKVKLETFERDMSERFSNLYEELEEFITDFEDQKFYIDALLKIFENLRNTNGDISSDKDNENSTQCQSILVLINKISKSINDLQEIYEEYEYKNVFYPLKITKDDTTFQNFGFNRTQSFRLAKKSFPEADYCLLLDADMILINNDFDKSSLKGYGYHLYQKGGNLKYKNIRLISTKIDWHCVGVTHEYWDSIPGCHKLMIEDSKMYINDVGDGGCKADKFIRDIRLLTEGLEKETNESLRTRYKFYLAQSYKDSGKPEKAIEWYKKRIDAAGWEEEVWYSYYTIGICYKRLRNRYYYKYQAYKNQKTKDEDEEEKVQALADENEKLYIEHEGNFIRWMTEAYDRRPWRVEPIMTLATFYREKSNKGGAAYMYAKMASDPYCQKGLKDGLFVEHRMYDILPFFEISIVAYHIQRYQEGYDACKKILNSKNVPYNILKMTQDNIKYYEKYFKSP